MCVGTTGSGKMSGSAAVGSFLLLGFFVVLCKSQNQNLLYNKLEVNVKEDFFQCYDCNSEYDKRCGDPFDPYTIGKINCSQRSAPEHLTDPLHMDQKIEPVLCRKIVQKVEGNVRVIRGCGYIKDPHDDKKCFRRTGTSAVEVIHCSCTKKLCNAGRSLQRPIFIVFSSAIVLRLAINTLLNGLP